MSIERNLPEFFITSFTEILIQGGNLEVIHDSAGQILDF